MKTFLKTAVATGVMALASMAQAQIIAVDLYKPGGVTSIVQDITDIDYNSNGAAVVTGAGPFGAAPVVGDIYVNRLMTNVTGFNRGPAAVGSGDILAGLNNSFATGGYEITAVAYLVEQVIISAANSATFVALGGVVQLYYDDAATGGTQANLVAGTGYDDGALIYSGSVISGGAAFAAFPPLGIGFGSVNITAVTSSVDTTAIQNLPGNLLSFFLNAEGQTAYPAGNADTNNYFIGGAGGLFSDYTADACTPADVALGSCDLKLRFDGSSRFVPEPDSLALVGIAALGLGLVGRRKSRKQD